MRERFSLAIVAMACVALVAVPTSASVATSVFFSEVGAVGGGAAVGNPAIVLEVGDPLTLWLWSTADQNYDTSIGMNVRSTTPGVVALSGGDVYNPELLSMALGGVPAGEFRWQDVGVGDVDGDSVLKMNAVKVNSGTGISTANNGTVPLFKLLDPLYDILAQAFLLGEVTLDAVAPGATVLTIDQEGTALFVHNGAQISPEFGTASITCIPEPSSIALVVLGLVALAAYRKR